MMTTCRQLGRLALGWGLGFLLGACSVLDLAATANPAGRTPTTGRTPAARAPTAPVVFAFSAPFNGRDEIHLADTNGRLIQILAGDPDGASCPAFSPDGMDIAFCSVRNGKKELYLMAAGGTNPRRLTSLMESSGQASDCSCNPDAPLSWSPDGRWIALPVTGWDKDRPFYDIHAASGDGIQVVKLTTNPQRYGGLLWSPDSQSLLFSGQVDGQPDIRRVEIGTRKITPLTSRPIDGAPSSWSPDGRRLAYFADFRDGNFDIFVLNSGEDRGRRLTNANGFDSYPQWFPDGKSILFVSTRDGNHEIYRMSADGSGQVNLTNNPGAMDIWPSLSPDGNHIIYLTGVNNQWDSWIMNSDGSNRKKLTGSIRIPSKISWKP